MAIRGDVSNTPGTTAWERETDAELIGENKQCVFDTLVGVQVAPVYLRT